MANVKQHKRQVWLQSLVLGSLFCQPLLHAELPLIRLNTIFPPGSQIGTTAEVTIEGADLDDADSLLFSNPAIKSEPKIKSGSTNREPNKFVVTIPSNTAAGICDVRVAGRFGISNPRAFAISESPEINEKEPNDSFEEAMPLEQMRIVNGVANPAAYDYFKVGCTKGQRILARCEFSEIDSRLEPVLFAFDPNKNELAHSNRLLDFVAPETGDYYIQLHDLTFRGGPAFFYRLQVGSFPYIDYVIPDFAKASQTSTHKILGRNLTGSTKSTTIATDGKQLEETSVEITFPENKFEFASSIPFKPASAVLEGFDWIYRGTNGSGPPQFLQFSETPSPEPVVATNITLPCEIASWFSPTQPNSFSFSAKKGAVYWIEIFSDRLNLPSDPFLVVQRVKKSDKGELEYSDIQEIYDADQNLGGPTFKTSTRDPIWRFEVKEDADYRLLVRDLFNEGKGRKSYPFHLSIRNESPDFELVVIPSVPPNPNKDAKTSPVWSSFLRKEDKIALDVFAFRRDGFNGEINLYFEGLPTGVTMAPSSIPAGASRERFILISGGELSPFSSSIQLIGKAKIGDKEIVHHSRAGAQLWPVDDYTKEPVATRLARDFAIATTAKETAPITLDLAEDKTVETSLAAKVQVPIKITRRGEFNNPVKFTLQTDPPKDFEADGKATNATAEIDLAQLKLPVGTHTLHLHAQTSGKYRRVTPDEIKGVEQEIKTANESVQAAEKEIAELNEAKKKPDAKAEEIESKIKAAQAKKESGANLVKELNQKIQPADVTFTVYCKPITLKIAPSPIELALSSPAMSMKRSSKAEIPIKITRLYGYKDPVEISLLVPDSVKGLSAQKVTIPADQTEAKLVLETSTDVPLNEQKFNVQALAKLNGHDLKTEQPFTLTVAAN